MAKKKKKRVDVVYSTNPDFNFDYDGDEENETLPNEEQLLYVSIDRKKRKGKDVTLIEGFVGSDEDMKSLAKQLKSSCGVGGSAKDGEILIQGNHRDKIIEILNKEGYKTKRKGG
ncbi:MAG: translation initiation factor [Brumimicrobium sp.]